MRKSLIAMFFVMAIVLFVVISIGRMTRHDKPSRSDLIWLTYSMSLVKDRLIEPKEIRIWGRVTDAESGKPIGVTVIIGDEWDFTDVDGRFRTTVKPGLHHLKITKTFQKVIERCLECGSALSVAEDVKTLLETEITVNSSNQRVDFNFEVEIPAEYKKEVK